MENLLTWMGGTLVSAFIGSYLSAYLKRKGENLATHEDLQNLVDQVKATTESIPAWARGSRGGHRLSSRSSTRPYYGGGRHTASHGGTYSGGRALQPPWRALPQLDRIKALRTA